MDLEKRIKDLGERVKRLEKIDNCDYELVVTSKYIIVPISLFMKGIMDDKAAVIEQNSILRKQLEKTNLEKETITKEFLKLINKEREEELEII